MHIYFSRPCKSGVAQWLACWAHNPKVRGSKPRSATFCVLGTCQRVIHKDALDGIPSIHGSILGDVRDGIEWSTTAVARGASNSEELEALSHHVMWQVGWPAVTMGC